MPIPAVQAEVRRALAKNLSYEDSSVLGLPGSYLDRKVFPPGSLRDDQALLKTFVANPNHIGCHTLGESESAFEGTQAIERDLLRLCAEQILGADPDTWDGYVASGGTEANIQALWTYRNRFRALDGASSSECGVMCSTDAHYSIAKGADLLGLSLWQVPVTQDDRQMTASKVEETAHAALAAGVTRFIVVLNMGTTMFGSVDEPDVVLDVLDRMGLSYKAHVDAAFGGFIYPLVTANNPLGFRNPRLTSFTLDAHKMLQAPYGTGIHLIRKGYIEHVYTSQASYVPGLDCTLIGSRSGSNAVAVWMILQSHGSAGLAATCQDLVNRAERLCTQLRTQGVGFYRHPDMNVVTMRASDIPAELAQRFLLVPDTHDGQPEWVKVVVMAHVDDAKIDAFVAALKASRDVVDC